MAKFLSTIELSYQILQIIKSAECEIILVTPYLKLSKNLKDSLSDANRYGKQITLIFGKSELDKDEKAFLESLDNLNIFFHENLHGKCYFNENTMLITSMNLHEFSEKQNKEFGILIEEETDSGIFEDVIDEVRSILSTSVTKKKCKKEDFKSFLNEESFEEQFRDFLNSSFSGKRFKIEKFDDEFVGRSKIIISEDFIPNVDISIEDNIDFILNLNQSTCERVFNNNRILSNQDIRNDFRIYWNPPYEKIKVYKSISIKEKWDLFDNQTKFKYYKKAIDLVIKEIDKEFTKTKQNT